MYVQNQKVLSKEVLQTEVMTTRLRPKKFRIFVSFTRNKDNFIILFFSTEFITE